MKMNEILEIVAKMTFNLKDSGKNDISHLEFHLVRHLVLALLWGVLVGLDDVLVVTAGQKMSSS